DVGVVEGRGKPGFLDEALFVFLAGNDLVGEEFQRYGAFQLKVASTVYHPHAALADFTENLVVACNDLADCELTLSTICRSCSRGVCVSHRSLGYPSCNLVTVSLVRIPSS